MSRISLSTISIALALSVSAPALAANGQTTGPATLRSGPGKDFAEVARIPSGTRLTNHGCVNLEEWCRVRWGKHRGWVTGDLLAQVHTRGKTIYAAYPATTPSASDAFGDDEFGDEFVYGGAGYVLPPEERRKFRRDRRDRHAGKIVRVGSKRFFKVKPRRFLKVKPRGFLKVKPRGFIKR